MGGFALVGILGVALLFQLPNWVKVENWERAQAVYQLTGLAPRM
jgi:hypothetical protein